MLDTPYTGTFRAKEELVAVNMLANELRRNDRCLLPTLYVPPDGLAQRVDAAIIRTIKPSRRITQDAHTRHKFEGSASTQQIWSRP